MATRATSGMFRHFSYEKTVEEIKEAMKEKMAALQAKVVERKARIVRIKAEFDITDEDMIDLLTQAANAAIGNRRVQMSYSTAVGGGEAKIISAGVVQNLITEKTLIEQEVGSISHLQRIVRNLRPIDTHGENGEPYTQNTFPLTDEELDFLNF
jgi:hypothetical protein